MGVTVVDIQRDSTTTNNSSEKHGCTLCTVLLTIFVTVFLILLGYFIGVKCGVIEPCCGETVSVECCEFDFDF